MSKDYGNDRRAPENTGMSLPSAIIGMVLTGFLGFFVGNQFVAGPAGGTNVKALGNQNQPGAAVAPQGGAAAAGQVYNIKVGNSPVRGNANAKVTIVEFSDYQCPFCKKIEPVLEEVRKKYGDDVRIVWKDFPLTSIHPNAMPAAIAVKAMYKQGADKFFAFHDLLFQNQAEYSGKGNVWTPEQFEKFASQVPGVNIEQWKKDIQDPATQAAIDQDGKDATNFGVTGTPAFFVNGEFMKGAGDINKFSEVIDRQMKRADDLVAKGIAPDRLYAELTKDGLAKAGPKQGAADPNAVYKVTVPDSAPFKGPKDAKVTIVEFSDFQCPFCGKVEVAQKDPQGNVVTPAPMDKIMETYGKDVKIVFRNNPLSSIHPFAEGAAEASLAAHEQGKYWEMHKKLFENQRALTPADLENYAQQIGLDMDKFKAAMSSGKFKDQITADQAEAQKLGSMSTPGFFVNGRFIKGAAGFERFQPIIDEEIKKANDLIAKGIAQKDVYNELTKNGLTAAAAAPQRPRLDPNAVYNIPVTQADGQQGASDALVTIVEFSDFQCPFCARAATSYVDPRTQQEVKPAMPDVLAKYNGKVRFVFKHFPLTGKHPDAHLAAEAVLAAGEQNKFWQMHDIVFTNQSKGIKRPDLENYAQQIGLDMTKFKAALDGGKFVAQVDADQQLGQKVGVPGTPTFYINGKTFNGAPTVDGFSAAIDAALKDAEAMVASGVAKKDVYNKIIEKGASAPVYLPTAPMPGAPTVMPAAPGQPGGPNVIQLPTVQPGQPIVIQGGGGQAPVITTPPTPAPVAVPVVPTPAPKTPKAPKK
jgi:protein-disulfide isomerase